MLEHAEVLLFLLSAMTFINMMSERNIFDALRARLVSSGLSLHVVFWLTGMLASSGPRLWTASARSWVGLVASM